MLRSRSRTSTIPPQITAFAPADRSLDLIPGSSQSFSVTASDPEGDVVSVQWLVDGTPTATGPTFTYTPSLASGGLHIIEVVATDASPLGGWKASAGSVALPAPADSANLSIAMSGTSESGQGSIQLTYQITATNNGPAPATGVMLTDTLPAGLSFGSMTASQGSCTSLAPGTVTCALGNLASGASATATLLGTPTTTATITNTARVTAAEFDPDLGNNSTSQGIEVDFLWFMPSEIAGYDDYAHVAVDTSGVYLSTVDEGGPAFLIKYDTSGTEVWRHALFAYQQVGHGVAADTSGVYTIGFTGVGRFLAPSISKFDADGTELWTRQFGGGSQNPTDIAVAAGSVYVVVQYANNPYLIKYDMHGTELWEKPLPGFSLLGLGTQSQSLAADSSGIYVVYYHVPPINGYALSKYDVDGNEVWTTSVGDISVSYGTLAVDAGGVYLVATGPSGFVRKYTKDGAELWTRQVELFGTSHMAVVSDGSTVYVGGIYPVGSPHHPGFIRKYDVDGNELSAHLFGDATSSVTGVQDFAVGCAGVFAAGHTQRLSGQSDTFVMQLSSPAIRCNPQAPTVSTTSPLVVVNEGQVGRNSGIYANAGANLPVSLAASVGALTKTGRRRASGSGR